MTGAFCYCTWEGQLTWQLHADSRTKFSPGSQIEAGGSADLGRKQTELALLEKSHALRGFSNLFISLLLILVSFGLSGMKRRKRAYLARLCSLFTEEMWYYTTYLVPISLFISIFYSLDKHI